MLILAERQAFEERAAGFPHVREASHSLWRQEASENAYEATFHFSTEMAWASVSITGVPNLSELGISAT